MCASLPICIVVQIFPLKYIYELTNCNRISIYNVGSETMQLTLTDFIAHVIWFMFSSAILLFFLRETDRHFPINSKFSNWVWYANFILLAGIYSKLECYTSKRGQLLRPLLICLAMTRLKSRNFEWNFTPLLHVHFIEVDSVRIYLNLDRILHSFASKFFLFCRSEIDYFDKKCHQPLTVPHRLILFLIPFS